jgi:hypothetical protein
MISQEKLGNRASVAGAANRVGTAFARPGPTSTAEAFEAEISTSDQGRSLFFIASRTGTTPDAAVSAVGGTIVTRLHDVRRVLAIAPLAAHAQLRTHRDLELAGPVSVEPQRFERFARLIGLGQAEQPRLHTPPPIGELR